MKLYEAFDIIKLLQLNNTPEKILASLNSFKSFWSYCIMNMQQTYLKINEQCHKKHNNTLMNKYLTMLNMFT